MVSQFIQIIFFLFLTTTTLLQNISGEELEAKLSSTKLPNPTAYIASVYDGQDDIYLLGGRTAEGSIDSILKFSITNESLELIASFPVPTSYGVAAMNPSTQEIFYLGNRGSDSIVKFDIKNGQVEEIVEKLPEVKFFTSSAQNGETLYIFGGQNEPSWEEVVSFNMNSQMAFKSGRLSRAGQIFRSSASTADNKAAEVILFGNFNNSLEYSIIKYNMATGDLILSNVPALAEISFGSTAIWDGKFAYVLGYLGPPRNDVLLQYDPEEDNVQFLPVTGLFPGNATHEFDFSGVSYIPKLRRIYMFGGRSRDSSFGSVSYRDEIWFIDLPKISVEEEHNSVGTINHYQSVAIFIFLGIIRFVCII